MFGVWRFWLGLSRRGRSSLKDQTPPPWMQHHHVQTTPRLAVRLHDLDPNSGDGTHNSRCCEHRETSQISTYVQARGRCLHESGIGVSIGVRR